MRIINILGVLVYLYFGVFYNSYRCYIIFINGILFHTNEKNIYLKYYDIVVNGLITFYTIYNCPITIIGASIGCFSFLINMYFLNKGYYNNTIGDTIHVLFTQWIMCYTILLDSNT
jgi:hypothetical protein